MYSKHEASQLRKEFWTAFGLYMKPVPSADGEKVNWLNYKTGVKDIAFKMNANNKTASIAIEITHHDVQLQQLYFERFAQVKNILHTALQEEWNWMKTCENGKPISKIYIQTSDVNVFDKAAWPAIISFLKPRIIALDQFWSFAKYGFEDLR